MKKILMLLVLLPAALSCSRGEYGYYGDAEQPYYGSYEHSQEPPRTLTGKLIFDYTFSSFLSVEKLMTQVLTLDKCLRAAPQDSASMIRRYFYDCVVTCSDGVWRISNREQMLIVETGGRVLSDRNADWNVYCNIDGLYIVRDSCHVRYGGENAVSVGIAQGRFNNQFVGSADLTVSYRANELNVSCPFLLDISGSGNLENIVGTRIAMCYAVPGFLRQVDSGRYIFFNGDMTIDARLEDSASESVVAKLSALDRIAITYGGITDEWIYGRRMY